MGETTQRQNDTPYMGESTHPKTRVTTQLIYAFVLVNAKSRVIYSYHSQDEDHSP